MIAISIKKLYKDKIYRKFREDLLEIKKRILMCISVITKENIIVFKLNYFKFELTSISI